MTDEKLASIIMDYVDEHYPDKPLISMAHVMAWLRKNGHIESKPSFDLGQMVKDIVGFQRRGT